jgi:hypothetical protein
MNFIEAIKLVKDGKAVHRSSWENNNMSSVQVSMDNYEIGIVKYHVAACEIHFTPDDVLADDWTEGDNF